ncbi:hypothetical protein [Pseudarthrobacter sp. PS3-L1]|uniref:hypothetical protein n=1 Tax=Pseudarthrobacter sp. PS3-L1 TaxID=3046207 RepID=UPI0024BB17F3|nr:hypothetical protein [Pseudarthrobacter sp. PS3-L1]MDJ0321640.1 hypothetical protein [Pseudarthrobacter sp. PS3-L1]
MNIEKSPTGLPELPENQWWEVQENFRYESFLFSKRRDGYKVCIMTSLETPAKRVQGKKWYNAPTIQPAVTVTMILDSLPINDPERVKRNHEAWDTQKPEYSFLAFAAASVTKEHITPEDIRATANKLLERCRRTEELAALEAKADAYLGAYPPKRLA